ncbi:hypothetical protein SAMN05421847_0190 [Halpernia humi]|uniref:Uncharacterized protein n=1 Tax=Halpernia humi TaxID=493375 RepID=A0A1H5SLC0_9FLAO|nr:hypothetical protein [Halpernia humi]SEF51412.1 hypothetical protein SAMN05421847_0190 [Halpernia humi]
MKGERDTVFQMTNENNLIQIICLKKEEQQGFDYFVEELNHQNLDFVKPKIHESFYSAFDELNERFPWHTYHLEYSDEDFRDYVADCLVEKVNDSKRMFFAPRKRHFEDILKIHLKTKDVKVKTGVFSIEVCNLNKETQYFYQEFVDSYAQEIGQKFKLESTTETWETYSSDSFDFIGNIEVLGNSVLKDSDGDICYVLAADKYKFTATPLTYTAQKWEWNFVKRN